MKKLLLFTLILSIHFVAHAQDAFSTLEERMSGKEFKETGLSKLTDEELAALNEWARSHSVATLENSAVHATAQGVAADAASDTRGLENQAKRKDDGYDDTIHSNIVGNFTGWKGRNTVFTLENGMVWEQAENDSFHVRATENAEIMIKKGMMGGWRLSMVGYNNTVRVKRIE